MTLAERLQSLRHIWDRLNPKGLLAVVETPNRLWYFDLHTSWLPFFNWLPDELAFHYSRFSPKTGFNARYREMSADQFEHFLRRGRGASYHEFDVAIADARTLDVVSSLATFRGRRQTIREPRIHRLYKRFLRTTYPRLHSGFLQPNLDIVIQK